MGQDSSTTRHIPTVKRSISLTDEINKKTGTKHHGTRPAGSAARRSQLSSIIAPEEKKINKKPKSHFPAGA
jgi:hypothetical protein